MFVIKNILLLVVSTAMPALAWNSCSVLAGLQKIDADLRYLGTANQGYNGSAASVGPINAGVTALQTDLNATVKLAELSRPFSECGAQNIINYVIYPLEPDNAFALNTTEANREQIRQGGFYAVVQQELKSLQASVDKLSAAIERKTPANQLAAAKAALGKYQNDYVEAIAYFS